MANNMSMLAQNSQLSNSNHNSFMSLSDDIKNNPAALNTVMTASGMSAGMNLGFGMNMNHMAMANTLESMLASSGIPSSMGQLTNSHMAGLAQQQHNSNGFGGMGKRDHSPSNMMNNNGLANLNMNLNMHGMGSIFDPHPMVMPPMQLPPQMQMKKEDKMNLIQQQLPQKMDGTFLQENITISSYIFFALVIMMWSSIEGDFSFEKGGENKTTMNLKRLYNVQSLFNMAISILD